MNQARTHLLAQMVLKTYAGDLDLLDRRRPRRRSHSRSAYTNSLPAFLPAISINKLQVTQAERLRTARMDACAAIARAPQKENQCPEN